MRIILVTNLGGSFQIVFEPRRQTAVFSVQKTSEILLVLPRIFGTHRVHDSGSDTSPCDLH